jgi:hypothetical protein
MVCRSNPSAQQAPLRKIEQEAFEGVDSAAVFKPVI